jgi:hypothetical protein
VQGPSLTKIAGGCAVLTTACFVAGIVLMSVGGVQVLIPETGKDGLDWIAAVDEAGGLFAGGAWLVVIGGALGLVALVGFYEPLKEAHGALIVAPVLATVGMVFVTISHSVPIALSYELVPAYVDATGPAKEAIAANFDMWAVTCLVFNYIGDVPVWGIVVPLYAWASLKTRAVPRWIGWLGLATGVFAGLLGALSPLSSVIDGVTFVGFLGFFVWITSMGVVLLRGPGAGRDAPVPVLQ